MACVFDRRARFGRRKTNALEDCAAKLAFTLLALAVPACYQAERVDPCRGVSCSGHGYCHSDRGVAECTCFQGFVARGLDCLVQEADADADIDADADVEVTDATPDVSPTEADVENDADADTLPCDPLEELCPCVEVSDCPRCFYCFDAVCMPMDPGCLSDDVCDDPACETCEDGCTRECVCTGCWWGCAQDFDCRAHHACMERECTFMGEDFCVVARGDCLPCGFCEEDREGPRFLHGKCVPLDWGDTEPPPECSPEAAPDAGA